MAEITRNNEGCIFLGQIWREDVTKILLALLVDRSYKNRDNFNINPEECSDVQIFIYHHRSAIKAVYPSKTFRTQGKCISILCSSSSVSRLMSSKDPVSRSSSIADGPLYLFSWTDDKTGRKTYFPGPEVDSQLEQHIPCIVTVRIHSDIHDVKAPG